MNYDMNTFRGSINTVMSLIREKYPCKTIVLMTPIHRAYACFGGSNVQHDELYTNKTGRYFDEYVETVREAARIWSAELIDLCQCSGLYPMNDKNAERYFANIEHDRIHPNKNGHERMAKVIMGKMDSIPLF